MKPFYGYKEGCSYCGEPLRKKWTMNPFYNPSIVACDRRWCSFKRSFIPKIKSSFRDTLFFVMSKLEKWVKALE